MANFVPSKKQASDFNDGVQYVNNDIVQPSTINNLVESALYSQGVVEQNATDIENDIATLTTTLNNGIQQAQSLADSAISVANEANNKVDDFIASTDSQPPPVGYHYIQFSGESTPANRWSGTSWVIDTDYKGRTIIGSGDGYVMGQTGGESSHTLTSSEMPSHSHSENADFGTGKLIPLISDAATGSNVTGAYFTTGSAGSLNLASKQVLTGSTGGSSSHNNMQPYKVVNIWKRTA